MNATPMAPWRLTFNQCFSESSGIRYIHALRLFCIYIYTYKYVHVLLYVYMWLVICEVGPRIAP